MVKEYIDLHKEDEIRLKDIAREFGYTEYYLTKKFHNETGTTIKEYIRDVRLEYSKYLLKHEKEPVREISDRLRFTSQSYFTDCFRKKYGMTPNEYRQTD
jgi:AraC-like DNA-binding protein